MRNLQSISIQKSAILARHRPPEADSGEAGGPRSTIERPIDESDQKVNVDKMMTLTVWIDSLL